jgi:hypothetical protein
MKKPIALTLMVLLALLLAPLISTALTGPVPGNQPDGDEPYLPYPGPSTYPIYLPMVFGAQSSPQKAEIPSLTPTPSPTPSPAPTPTTIPYPP